MSAGNQALSNARRWLLPALVLAIGLVGSLLAALLLARAEQDRRQARFEGMASGAVAAIESRMFAQHTLLRGAAGFFHASDSVSRRDYHDYVSRLRLEENYPGVLGIGYAAYAPDRPSLDRLIASSRAPGDPPFQAWPGGVRPGYSAVLFLEPMHRLNRAALGFDMLSEATRRSAMIDAANAGRGRVSGRLRLVQEIDPVKQPGFLIYAPVYDEPAGGAERSPRPLAGWIYSPVRAHDLFGAIFEEHKLDGLIVEIFDEAIGDDRLLYRNGDRPAGTDTSIRRVPVSGRVWLIRVTASAALDERSPLLLASIVAAAGTLITLLLAALMLQQARAAAITRREVKARTIELSDANALLRDEATAREQAEAEVRQMQKMEAIGQLTGGIAHDFNNMLAVIVGNIEMAQRRFDEPEKMRRPLANARLGADKAAELTRRLLAFGRRQALSPRAVDANQLIGDMIDLLRRALGETIRLDLALADQLWPTHVDPSQLENAVLNLAINGRDAMTAGGVLTITTANCELDEAWLKQHRLGLAPGGYVLLAVRDTGEGMPPEIVSRALEPFFTTKEVGRGTGLGLSQVYGFVSQSGGHLQIDSAVGEGTAIRIYLPRDDRPSEAPAPKREAENGSELARARPGETVLIAEDEEQVREMAVETLTELGYGVRAAPNGAEALAMLEAEPGISLLFTDVVMPRMDGRRLAEAAAALRPGLPVLFTTGYTGDAIVHGGRLDSGVELLQKPYTAQALAARIRALLDVRTV